MGVFCELWVDLYCHSESLKTCECNELKFFAIQNLTNEHFSHSSSSDSGSESGMTRLILTLFNYHFVRYWNEFSTGVNWWVGFSELWVDSLLMSFRTWYGIWGWWMDNPFAGQMLNQVQHDRKDCFYSLLTHDYSLIGIWSSEYFYSLLTNTYSLY